MNNLFAYLVELNISLMILYVAYKLFFEKDKNFTIRRIYLMGVVLLPLLLPLLPDSLRMPVGQMTSLSISLEEITIFGSGAAAEASNSLNFTSVLLNRISKVRLAKMLGVMYFTLVTSRNVATGIDPLMDFGEVTYEPVLADSRWSRHREYLKQWQSPSPPGNGGSVRAHWADHGAGRTFLAIRSAEENLAAAGSGASRDLHLVLREGWFLTLYTLKELRASSHRLNPTITLA